MRPSGLAWTSALSAPGFTPHGPLTARADQAWCAHELRSATWRIEHGGRGEPSGGVAHTSDASVSSGWGAVIYAKDVARLAIAVSHLPATHNCIDVRPADTKTDRGGLMGSIVGRPAGDGATRASWIRGTGRSGVTTTGRRTTSRRRGRSRAAPSSV